MKEFIKNNKQTIIIILAVLSTIIGVKAPIGSDVSAEQQVLLDAVSTVITPIVREVVKEELGSVQKGIDQRFDEVDKQIEDLVMQSYNADIDEIALALADIRTAEEVDKLYQYWVDNGWTKKISAIQRISEFQKARDKLEERLYSEEVFKTLMTHTY